MTNKMKALIFIGLCLALAVALAGCNANKTSTTETNQAVAPSGQDNAASAPASAQEKIDLKLMAAPQSGAWYPLAVAVTESLKKNMENLGQVSILPGGGVSNVVGVNNGQAQLGFSQAAPMVDGVLGVGPFKEKTENVRYMLSLFPHKTHIVVLEGSGIESIEDIKGKRINVGTVGLLTEDVARRILEAYGMSYKDMGSVQNLSFADSVEQMKDGRLDVLFWTVPDPFAVITDLAQSKEIKLLPLPENLIQKLTSQNSGLIPSTIKAGTYQGVDVDIPTIQSPLVVLAHKDAPEELVYQMTKTIHDEFEALKSVAPQLNQISVQDLTIDIGVPMHPAAEKFFKEQGLIS